MSNRAWVTLATNDSYGLGALVLAHSLRRATSSYPAVVLITPSVTDAMRERLRAVFADVVTVDVLDSRDATHLALLQRPELGITFTKIHCWSLTQFEKCVFLDADTLVIQNCDELFEREELSAAPDVGWPDCFNSGVFVYKPSNETFEQLIKFAQERGSFDGGDQGLLNSFFSEWAHGDINKHLPFLYNVTSAAFYSYIPALKHYGQDLKIIHFIGIAKPWLQQFNWESRTVEAPEHLRELLQLWWDLFVGQVHSQLDVTMSGVAGNLARVTPGASGSQREALDELTRRQGWEAGNIDYMGADSFDNIWAKISQTLSQPRVSPPKQPSPPKEPSPPKQEAPVPPVEVAQEAASVDAPAPEAASTPVETEALKSEATEPSATEAVSVVETPVTPQAVAPVETPASAEVPVTVETVDSAPKVDVPAAVATPAVEPTESVAPAEIPATVEAVAADASIPQEVPAVASPVEPSDIPATVEAASAPGEAPKTTEAPSEAPISVESAAAPEVAKDEPQKTETPALPPTPPVTPKSTPESTPVSESAPEVEPVQAQAEVSVSAPEPASESAPQVESVEIPKEEVPVTSSEPVSESAPKVESEIPKQEVSAPTSAPVLESAPAVESVEPKKEEVSEPASVPASESAPKVELAESPKEEVLVSESVPASESTPKVETQKEEVSPASAPASESTPKVETQKEEVPPAPTSEGVPQVEPVETPKEEAPVPVEAPDPEAPATPASSAPASPAKPDATPEKPSEVPSPAASTDSPPLANTPSKEEAPALPAAKSEERRKVGKLQLSPPAVADPLPTPDSELEDAASLAQSIIAGELRTPTVTAPESAAPTSPPLATQDKRLSVEEPEVPTPPISLAQIGVKPAPKAKPTTAAQIESSLAEKSEPVASADQPAPKKKVVKKVKKESAAGGEAPVPPPRKKEKKPKEK